MDLDQFCEGLRYQLFLASMEKEEQKLQELTLLGWGLFASFSRAGRYLGEELAGGFGEGYGGHSGNIVSGIFFGEQKCGW